MEDYELVKQLYRGKASLLYRAVCRRSRQTVALKLYRKHKLSTLNWYQVAILGLTSPPPPALLPHRLILLACSHNSACT